ncbi:DUF3054 domain-containing protein [Gulosibacter bifidus]|uniref:DUF3054 domain-containing protein n=1 Tax=Gulosibacter bifidus TaxID=272239 RepID=A0ABW5RI02_9MICO|nr:DUF3054 domain-containing protein [Gulosibacter bifidus]
MNATTNTRNASAAEPTASAAPAAPNLARLGCWLLIDLVLVGVFALLGRSAHNSALDFGGWFGTASPFLVALAVGWALALALGIDPTRVRLPELVVYVVTVALGLGIRVLTGETAALPFVLVTAGVLAVFLLLPRLVMQLVTRRR